MLPPNQHGRSTEPLLRRVPPEMIPREEKPVPIEQGHATSRMAWHGNDLKLRHDMDTVSPLNGPFRIRSRINVCLMNHPLRTEVCSILLCISHIVFMREE